MIQRKEKLSCVSVDGRGGMRGATMTSRRWEAGTNTEAERQAFLPEVEGRPPVHSLGTGQGCWSLWEFLPGSVRFL